ncbi:hypothetical protein [Alteromonas ponticola]|uniref:DUF3316 domain-containing protein n=1 Tax=Alteromonas ponticola TaxID=2720613 RepID=A0ABX1R0L0_9ALTE|nr:hypothetical protein [Alteromonas ponticola]NMH60005.1 hypothetical protein [Alteromonas ponticola]
MKTVPRILTALLVLSASGVTMAESQGNDVLNQVITAELQQHVALTSQELNSAARNDVLNTSYQFSPKVSEKQMVAKVTVRQLKEVDLREDTARQLKQVDLRKDTDA